MRSVIAMLLVCAMLVSVSTYTLLGARRAGVDPGDISIEPAPRALRKEGAPPVYSKSAYDITPLSPAKIEELAKPLTDEERRIILKKGTEPAFCGTLLDNKLEGTYICRLCGLPLFASQHKFNSGTGWPSFYRPFDPAHITYIRDDSHGMERIEITCARCDGHLGHVFEDGPKPTGLRYCLNGASLSFVGKDEPLPPQSRPVKTETAYLAGGCFWGVEDLLQATPGVIDAISGYMGGTLKDPTYKAVCNGDTGHAETVKVVFDPKVVSYEALLKAFFRYHDPTQLNRQGPDVGTQYRSAIFTVDEAQAKAAAAFIEAQSKRKRFAGKRIATQVQGVDKAGQFYPAEAYHQDYHEKHGGHCAMPMTDDED